MTPQEFRKIRDELNENIEHTYAMIKWGDSWAWAEVDNHYMPSPDEDLEGIEYNEITPEGLQKGNLLGFIYMNQNCPAVLGYGRRNEEEKSILKYIWKVNHSVGGEENIDNERWEKDI